VVSTAACSGSTPAQRPLTTTRHCRPPTPAGVLPPDRRLPLSRRRNPPPPRPQTTEAQAAARRGSSGSVRRRRRSLSDCRRVRASHRRPSLPPRSATDQQPSTAFTVARQQLCTRNTSEILYDSLIFAVNFRAVTH